MGTSCDWFRGVGRTRVYARTRIVLTGLMVCTAPVASADTVYGPPLSVGEGVARVYLVTSNGEPEELGVAVDAAFLDALPANGAEHGMVMPDGNSTFEYVLDMPDGNPTPFRHVTLDWNPAGHAPDGIYDVAHLDVHFYLITNDERIAIHPDDPAFEAKGARLPDASLLPEGYVNPGIPPVPLMGLHLVDPSSPELRETGAEPFTQTFFYGSWDGQLIFAEPMVTTAYLRARQDLARAVPVAREVRIPGYYPAGYSISWDEPTAQHRIALTALRKM